MSENSSTEGAFPLLEMSTPFGNLSSENYEQVCKYLTFFRNKKDGIVRTLHREVKYMCVYLCVFSSFFVAGINEQPPPYRFKTSKMIG